MPMKQRPSYSKFRSLSLQRTLLFIFRVSYIALDFEKRSDTNFDRWSTVKRRLNLLINTVIFDYLSKISDQNTVHLYEQFIIDAVSDIISYHCKRRLKLYRACNKLPFNKRKAFVIASLMMAYYYEIKQLIFKVVKLKYSYKVADQNYPEEVDLVLGFPRHAFSLSEAIEKVVGNGLRNTPSSFGEYLSVNRVQTDVLFSIFEYEIHSKKKSFTKCGSEEVREYPRIRVTTESKWLVFNRRIIRLLYHYLKTRPSIPVGSLLLKIIYIRKWLFSFNFENILSAIEVNETRVRTIFVFPFEDMGLLRYNNKNSSKIIAYSYSQNEFTPPAKSLTYFRGPISESKLKDILADIPLEALKLNGNAVGFTDIFNQLDYVRQALNNYMGCSFPAPDFTRDPQLPVLVGFKPTSTDWFDKLSTDYIAVFDTPPEDRQSQLSRTIMGDRTGDYEVVAEFLSECVHTCLQMGYGVMIKPKYSLSNYDERYQSLMKKFQIEYGNKVIIVDPYTRMELIMHSAKYSINMPYTSTKLVAESYGLSSTYYMPEMYRNAFGRHCENQDIIFGNRDLTLFLGESK